MSTNNALRVFWKSREWNMKTSAFDSDEDILLLPKRKRFRKKKSRPVRHTKRHEEEQVYEQRTTLPCSICKHEIDLPGIFLHKKQHVALATLGFQWMGRKKPQPSVIAVQRQFMISKLLSSFMLTEKTLQSINNAFELLWKKQIPAYYKIFDNIDRSVIHSQKICHLLIKGVGICEDRNSTWKADMNDKFTVVSNFGNKPNVCFFGLFDGHHGASAAELTSMELPVLLLHQLSKFDPSYQMTTDEQQIINSFYTVFREEYTAIEDLFSAINKTEAVRCNVQAVLCRNGKGFCLTKEHTTRNTNERRRILQNGAVISSNEPYGLVEGQVKTTRGLGFHGNLKMKKSIIPAPQTISVPIDDLCQFLILATNGLWEVLDKEEVTALAMTTFHMYKETYCPIIPNKSSPTKGPLLFSTSEPNLTKSQSNIHILFQYKSVSEVCVSTTNSKENLSDSNYSKYCIYNPENVETFPAETTHRKPCSEKVTDRPTSVNGVATNEKESDTKSFYEGAAEYVSHELVNAALLAGSRDNITVMVIFLNGSEYQLLT
ncbi:protein phosphatase 2C-like domain-containing protein 1 isoform X3 [Pongo pygmaeus]|uniref:protein phosphatase 2C-like domain-containing protein 1 isoform X3 n=1 Tax=Pongo pygmaeus TaxID=9600 RepID=UPI0023E27E21|nr:protein phosphatase 2C-like domain-containing protein 1 isoform X3 [Pongo pygmaeus]